MTDLGTLGGTSSRAFGVNVQGQVVGDSTTASGASHAFVWEIGVMTDLGTLGGTYSNASSINDRGVIVGSASTGTERHAVMWTVTN
jgi:probable HAF family extracellular repeat protein